MGFVKTFLNYFENANLIIKGKRSGGGDLWLGNYLAANDIEFIAKNNISVIINCTTKMPFINETVDSKELAKYGLNLETRRLEVEDSLLEVDLIMMQHYLNFIIPYILKQLKNGKNVIVHCHAGRQRSACIIAGVLYVSEYKQKNMNEIIKFILEKRPQSFSFGYRINFKKSLERYFNIKID